MSQKQTKGTPISSFESFFCTGKDWAVANHAALGTFVIGSLFFVIPLSVFNEVWILLDNTPPIRLYIFTVSMFAISFLLTMVAIWETEGPGLRFRRERGLLPSSDGLIWQVVFDSCPVWIMFLVIAFLLVFLFLWTIGRFGLNLQSAALCSLGTASGISLESFHEFKAPSIVSYVYHKVNEMYEELMKEAKGLGSNSITPEKYFEFYDRVKDLLEVDPQIRDVLHLISPFEELYVDTMVVSPQQPSVSVLLSDLEQADLQKHEYFENTEEYRKLREFQK